MNTNHTLIVMLLDASGSMQNIKQATIDGINNFINQQKTATLGAGVDRPIDLSSDLSGRSVLTCNLTIAAFSSNGTGYNLNSILPGNGEPLDYNYNYTLLHNNEDINTVNDSWSARYNTVGGTPLIDAFCKCIDDTKKMINNAPVDSKPGRVIFVSVTDGEENSSTKFTRQQLNSKIKSQTDDHNWQFVFLGANQDAIQEATNSGIAANNSITYAANASGIARAFASTSSMITNKRLARVEDMTTVSYCVADYAAQDVLLGSAVNSSHFTAPQQLTADDIKNNQSKP